MAAEVIDKVTGEITQAPVDAITLQDPSVVRLQINREAVSALEKSGDDLVIRLGSGLIARTGR